MDGDGVHRIHLTGLAVVFYKIDVKIKSLMKDLNNGSYSSSMIQDCRELNSVHRGLKHNWFDRILKMYPVEATDDQPIVVTDRPQDFVVMQVAIRFFARKLQNMNARADHLLCFKKAYSSSTDNEELSDEDTATSPFTVDLGVLFVPRTTFANRLGLPYVSDDDWKLVEAILAESTDIPIELSTLLAELYIQLLPRDNTEGMSGIYEFLGNLKELCKENPNRNFVKWMCNVDKVAYEKHCDLDGSEKLQQGKTEAVEVKNLLRLFIDAILALETLNDFSELSGYMTVYKAVDVLDVGLMSIKLD